jgi:hypothetical protein
MEKDNHGANCAEPDASNGGGAAAALHSDGFGSTELEANDDWLALRQFDWRARVRRHPYAMLAAATGVGYLLGGGLFSRSTARIVGFAASVGARLLAVPIIRDELLGLVGHGTAPGRDGNSDNLHKK